MRDDLALIYKLLPMKNKRNIMFYKHALTTKKIILNLY
jgi:hypothetical protein